MSAIILKNQPLISSIFIGNSLEHFRQASLPATTAYGRVFHTILALVELIPFIGVIEWIVARCLLTQAPTPIIQQMVSSPTNPSAPVFSSAPVYGYGNPSRSKQNTALLLPFLENRTVYDTTPSFCAPFDKIKECDCRFCPRKGREALLSKTMSEIEIRFPDKERPFQILSIGAGGCLQELTYVYELHKRGYQSVELVVLESTKEIYETVDSLQKFIRKELPSSFQFQVKVLDWEKGKDPILTAKIDKEIHPQLALLIDLDTQQPDILETHTDFFEARKEELPKNINWARLEERALYCLDQEWKIQNCLVSCFFQQPLFGNTHFAQTLFLENNHYICDQKRIDASSIRNALSQVHNGFDRQGVFRNIVKDKILLNK